MIDILSVKIFIICMDNKERSGIALTGENLAALFLERKGCQIIARNYHSAYGEIDVIALKEQEIIFAEVKTRTGRSVKAAQNSISTAKQRKLTLTALHFLSEKTEYSEYAPRFDVIAVLQNVAEGTFSIHHTPNAFPGIQPEFS